jgi:hypothetical protein
MYIKIFGRFFGIIIAFGFLMHSHVHGQNSILHSIQNRWNVKISASSNKTNDIDFRFITWQRNDGPIYKPRANMRAEFNYGVMNWVELGAYVGFMRHKAAWVLVLDSINESYLMMTEVALAPTFGVNVNFHLLPFWIRKTNCRWELYLTAKYGAAYLIKWVGYRDYGAVSSFSPYPPIWIPNFSRYRHEFGVGIGGGVYFWNLFGIYFEGMVGQYSYFPDMFHSNFSLRAGIEFKFISKKTKAKQQEIEEKYRKLNKTNYPNDF